MSKICTPKFQKIAELFLLIYLAECTIGSSGRWLEIGPLSIRIILFALCFFITLPFVFRDIKKLFSNFQILSTIIFGIYLIFCVGIGLYYGNNLLFIKSDLTTLLSFALFPGFISVMSNRDSIRRACDVIFFSAVVVALFTIVLHILFSFFDLDLVIPVANFAHKKSLGGIAILQTGIYRIFFRSQIFLQVAILLGVLRIKAVHGAKRIVFYILEGVLFFACILSYTRGFWVGLAGAAIVLLVLSFKEWSLYLKTLSSALTAFLALCALSFVLYNGPFVLVEIVNRFNPNLIVLSSNHQGSHTSSETDDSEKDPFEELPQDPELDITESQNQSAVDVRAASLSELKKRIHKHPLFGNGLGANLDNIRSDGRTEYMYQDITLKCGYLGLTLFIITFFYCAFAHIRNEIKYRKEITPSLESTALIQRNRVILSAYLSIAITSYFNPFLNNPMGIAFLMLTGTAILQKEDRKEETSEEIL